MGFDLASITAGGVSAVLGGIGGLAKDLREAITGDLPAEKKAEIEAKLIELDNQVIMGQLAINLEEAKNENIFVSGWRPFIGWAGGVCLAYSAIIYPTMNWAALVYGYTGTFPVLDNTLTMQILLGILGLGFLRSQDKKLSPSPVGKE